MTRLLVLLGILTILCFVFEFPLSIIIVGGVLIITLFHTLIISAIVSIIVFTLCLISVIIYLPIIIISTVVILINCIYVWFELLS